ncbi:MAG: hypothetical protein L6Q35_01800 [Phycisphaerales bacterium]|nr:hypothetical protein [Phycisphaerales bacterium]
MLRPGTAFGTLLSLLLCCTIVQATFAQVLPADRRPILFPDTPQAWGGTGVCYGEFRDGQYPGGPQPTEEQIREDLHIIARHWSVLRMYSSREATRLACKVIRADKLPLKVLVGAWIDQESKPGPDGKPIDPNPQLAKVNQDQVARAIAIANDYPDVVLAINIANEALVFWSGHLVPRSVVINYLRQARAATKVPVTTCDTELFWSTPESLEVAAECDFIALHAYAMWNGQSIRGSLDWTREQIAKVQARHPGMTVVMTELGWATQKGTQGDQARLIKAEPNEQDQEVFFRSLRDWAVEARQPYFWFAAFDENWKGGPEPSEVEKHWGVYRTDRTPKLVFRNYKPAK